MGQILADTTLEKAKRWAEESWADAVSSWSKDLPNVLLDIFGTTISSLKLVSPGFQVYNN